MSEHLVETLPFYVNNTLSAAQRQQVEMHLAQCAPCRAELAEWRRLGGLVEQTSAAPILLSPLSPLVAASRPARTGLRALLTSAATLIWAQRVLLQGNLLFWILTAAVLLAVLIALKPGGTELEVLPLFASVPILALLSVIYVFTYDQDPLSEIVEAAPTQPSILLWARLTLLLGLLMGLALVGSLLIADFDGGQLMLVVAAWLGPMLWLSALGTLLALLWHPLTAAALALSGWGGLLLLLTFEVSGSPWLFLHLRSLLHPDGVLLAGQMLLAGLLWLVCWLWLWHATPPALRLEGR